MILRLCSTIICAGAYQNIGFQACHEKQVKAGICQTQVRIIIFRGQGAFDIVAKWRNYTSFTWVASSAASTARRLSTLWRHARPRRLGSALAPIGAVYMLAMLQVSGWGYFDVRVAYLLLAYKLAAFIYDECEGMRSLSMFHSPGRFMDCVDRPRTLLFNQPHVFADLQYLYCARLSTQAHSVSKRQHTGHGKYFHGIGIKKVRVRQHRS